MNAALLAFIVFVAFALGYRYYSGFLARRVFALRDDEPTARYLQERLLARLGLGEPE